MKQALIMIIKRKALKNNKSVHKMWKMGEIATPPPPEKTLSPSPFTFVWYLNDKKNFFFISMTFATPEVFQKWHWFYPFWLPLSLCYYKRFLNLRHVSVTDQCQFYVQGVLWDDIRCGSVTHRYLYTHEHNKYECILIFCSTYTLFFLPIIFYLPNSHRRG